MALTKKMEKKSISSDKKLRYACCVCKQNIRTNSEACGTVFIERGINNEGSDSSGWQTAFAHGKCLVGVLPLAGYSFPEFVPKLKGQSKRFKWPANLP
jgi:hypothetical protein